MAGALFDSSNLPALRQKVRESEERVAAVKGETDQERTDALIELAVAQEALLNQLRGQRDPDDYEAIRVESDLGTTRLKLADVPKAIELQEDVVGRLQRTRGPDDQATIIAEQLLAIALRAAGDYRRVERVESDVLAARVRVNPDEPDTDRARCALADTKRILGNVRSAAQLFSRAVAGFDKSLGPGDGETINARGDLGVCLLALWKFREARGVLGQAHKIATRTLTPDNDVRIKIERLWASVKTIDQQMQSSNLPSTGARPRSAVVALPFRSKVHLSHEPLVAIGS